MERDQREWTAAAEVAERGLELTGDIPELRHKAGDARSQLGKDLFRQAQWSRADQEARKAERHLSAALRDVDSLEGRDYKSQSRIHRSVVINYEYLARIAAVQSDERDANHFVRMLGESLRRWSNEHPAELNAASERDRLVGWFPELATQLN